MGIDILYLSQTDISCDPRILKSIDVAHKSGLNTFSIGFKSIKKYINREMSNSNKKRNILTSYIDRITFIPKNFRNLIIPFEIIIRCSYIGIRKRPKIIHCNDVSPLPSALIIKLFTNSKIIYDAHELESKKNGIDPLSSILVFWFEKIAWSKIDYLITVSDSIREWYIKNYGLKESEIIYNSPILNNSKELNPNYLREKFKINNNKKIFIYIGILYPSRGIRFVIDAFLNQKDNVIVFLGDGPLKDEIINLSKRSNSNIFYHEPIEHYKVTALAKTSDYGICLIANASLSDYFSLPNKLFEYIFSGLPIIASNFPEIDRVLKNTKTGLCVELELDSIKNGIINLTKNYNNNSFDHNSIQNYSWQKQESKLAEIYLRTKSSSKN